MLVNITDHTRRNGAGDREDRALPQQKGINQELEQRTVVICPNLFVLIRISTHP